MDAERKKAIVRELFEVLAMRATTYEGEPCESQYVTCVQLEGDEAARVEESLGTAYADEMLAGWEES